MTKEEGATLADKKVKEIWELLFKEQDSLDGVGVAVAALALSHCLGAILAGQSRSALEAMLTTVREEKARAEAEPTSTSKTTSTDEPTDGKRA